MITRGIGSRRHVTIVLSAAVLSLALLPLGAFALTFTTVDVPGALHTQARGINERGQIVGFYSDAATGLRHGFLWEEGELTTIDVPGARATEASGINNRGQIVGFYTDAGGQRHGFVAQ
jgi:probable HAF family extracellular repeat protein